MRVRGAPAPERIRAILWSAKGNKPTRHVYVETLPCMVPVKGVPDGQPAWEHIFICTETNARRRYGIETRHAVAS